MNNKPERCALECALRQADGSTTCNATDKECRADETCIGLVRAYYSGAFTRVLNEFEVQANQITSEEQEMVAFIKDRISSGG